MESGCNAGDQIIQPFYRIGPPKKLSPLPYIIGRNFEKLTQALLHEIWIVSIFSTEKL